LTIRIDFFKSILDSELTIRFESSIPILEIESSKLSNRIDSNRQNSDRLIDPNSINRSDAVSLTIVLNKVLFNNTTIIIKSINILYILKLLINVLSINILTKQEININFYNNKYYIIVLNNN